MSYPPPPPGMARDDGIRRLSRLTWRAAQMSAIATVAFATLFARAAGANTTTTTSKAPVKSAAQPGQPTARVALTMKEPASCPAPKRLHRRRPQPAIAAPAAAAAPAPAPAPTLTPTPAPPAPAPSPAQTSSSGSHGGG